MTLAVQRRRGKPDLRRLIGSGDRIALIALPFLAGGAILNALFRSAFGVGGPPSALRFVAIAVLSVGVVNWAWCAWLILTRVPRGELITNGPYAVVKHPLYTGVALLVLPWVGLLCNSWLGALVGLAVYLGSRAFAPAEERELARTLGAAWQAYRRAVLIPWL